MKYRNWMFLHFKRFAWPAQWHANEATVSKSYKKKPVSLNSQFDRKKVSESGFKAHTAGERDAFY